MCSTPLDTPVTSLTMSVPVLRHPHVYHAFISYCADADTSHARTILDSVESRGFTCCFAERDFLPGECTSDVVVDAIHWYFNLTFFVFFLNIHKIFRHRYYGLHCTTCVIYKNRGGGGFLAFFYWGWGWEGRFYALISAVL